MTTSQWGRGSLKGGEYKHSLHTVARNQNLAFWYPVKSMQIDPKFTSNISGGFLLSGGHFSHSEMSKQEKFSKFILFYDLKHKCLNVALQPWTKLL